MNFKLLFLICLFFLNLNANYNLHLLKDEPIDVVIMLHIKDQNKIDLVIDGIRKFGKNIRRIITVSQDRYTQKAEWFNERNYPFHKADIAKAIFPDDPKAELEFANSGRVGWLMKQMFNLYAAFVIPDISSNILILDGDVIFLKPVEFIDKDGNALYNPGYGVHLHMPYFEHAKRLINEPNQIERYIIPLNGTLHPEFCGISHHMLFQKPVLEDLFNLIRQSHNMEPWQAICKCLDKDDVYKSAMAEYEIYFNFVFARSNQVKIRMLKWNDIVFKNEAIALHKALDYDFVACHHYMAD